METPETSLAARAGLKDGYGLGNYADDEEPLTQHGHDGGIDGFLSRYAYVPEAGVGYFFSINDSSPSGAEHAVHEIEQVLYAYMTRGTQAHQEPATKLPTGASEWTGYYQFAAPRQQKLSYIDLLLGGEFVSIKDDTMRARPVLGSARPLIPVGDNQFRTKQSEAATTIFTTDGKGQSRDGPDGAARHPDSRLLRQNQSDLADDTPGARLRRDRLDAVVDHIRLHLDPAQNSWRARSSILRSEYFRCSRRSR